MKALIFDFDYTIGDSSDGIAESINFALNKLGYQSRRKNESNKTIGRSLKDTFKILTNCSDDVLTGEFSRYFKEKADEVMVENTVLYPSVYDLLLAAKHHNYLLSIVTSKFHYRIEQILSKFGILNEFDVIVGAEDVKNEKTAPDGLLLALKTLGVCKSECIYIGDSTVDAEAAKGAGVNFIGVLTGTTDKT